MSAKPTIPVLMTAGFHDSWSAGGSTSIQIGTYRDSIRLDEGIHFVVLDRTDPTKAPVFKATAPDSTTPPPGLDPYLNENYLLLVSVAAFVTGMPQGDLCHLILTNGGGAKLKEVELLATRFTCGVSAGLVYLLASVPGSGLGGVEYSASRLSSASYEGKPYVTSTGGYRMLFNLVPNASGLYSPLPISG